MIRVVLIDDHKLVRQALRIALNTNSLISVVGEGEDGLEAVQLTKDLDPDIIVMDIMMPIMDGIEAVKEIKKFNSKVKILLLTMITDENYILDALSQDVDGCMFKFGGIDDLTLAINKILNNEKYYDSKITKIVLDSRNNNPTSKFNLTKRELEILKLIVEGLTSKEIAEKLFISLFTAQKHRKNLLSKLGVHGTAELVRFTMENRIV